MIADRRANPADDIVSRFLETEVDGDRLSHEDVLDICFLFLVAGLDTVSASLDCMMLHLATHPERRRAAGERPEPDPERRRGAAPVGVAGDDGRPGRDPGHRDRRLPGGQGQRS